MTKSSKKMEGEIDADLRGVRSTEIRPDRPAKISGRDPDVMTAGEINRELDKLERQNSALGQRMIDAGRGHERPSEYLKMDDPLSIERTRNFDRRGRLRAEIERRYGPGAPRRLPPGFRPIRY